MNVLEELENFYRSFNGEKGNIGFSEMGKPIKFLCVSYTKNPVIIFQYALHAREYITTYLAMEQIKNYQKSGRVGTCYFIPAVNVDGIAICLAGNKDYKANARGVDLNVNFDAGWGSGASNSFIRGRANYVGPYPFSESESLALSDFTQRLKPDMTVSYHSKGEEIYFEFGQLGERYDRDFRLAKIVSDITGYPIKSTPNSAGGYKDWCVEKLEIPAITVEICPDNLSHPIDNDFLWTAQNNFNVPNVLTERFYE